MFFEKKADFFKKINCCLSLQKRLAPRIYEGGAPVRTLGRGEHKKKGGQLPQSPPCGSDSRLRAARSAALTVHRTVIHYRQLRFAYPLQSGGQDCAPAGRAGRRPAIL